MKKTKQWLHESAFSFSGNVIILYVISFASLQAGLIFGFIHFMTQQALKTVLHQSFFLFSSAFYYYIGNVYYTKKAETAHSRFCFFYYTLKEL
ncbi:hypothetical protein [Bacillus paramycoides]|uniref:hypothetical protein n=1 Tax=Bacillus paramycoides TaxID=2026194 RepID=UPI003D03D80A